MIRLDKLAINSLGMGLPNVLSGYFTDHTGRLCR